MLVRKSFFECLQIKQLAAPKLTALHPPTEDLLEKPKEDPNGPVESVNQADDFRRHVEQVGGDPQDAVAARTRRTATVIATAGMPRGDDTHEPQGMPETRG